MTALRQPMVRASRINCDVSAGTPKRLIIFGNARAINISKDRRSRSADRSLVNVVSLGERLERSLEENLAQVARIAPRSEAFNTAFESRVVEPTHPPCDFLRTG